MTQPIDGQTGFVSGGTNLDAAARLIAATLTRSPSVDPDRHSMAILFTDGDPMADRQEQTAAAIPMHCIFIADTGLLDDATLLASIRGHMKLEG